VRASERDGGRENRGDGRVDGRGERKGSVRERWREGEPTGVAIEHMNIPSPRPEINLGCVRVKQQC